MNRPLLAATVSIALALVLTACGSASGIDNLFNQESGAGGAAATTSGHGGAAGVTTTASVGGAGNTTASVGATTSGPEATSGPVATSGPATTGPASSSSGGPTNTVFCNNAECAPGQICCFNLTQQNDHCGQEGSCGDGFVQLECNGPEDCPGGVCCADVDLQDNPPYKSISCKQSCNDPQNNLIICSDADPTCPPGKQCDQSKILGQGYKVCK